MQSLLFRFNTYLLCCCLLLSCGCRSGSTRKGRFSTLELHLEVNPDGTPSNAPVPVYRAQPIYVNVELHPFLTEANIKEAKVLEEELGGFGLMIEFDKRGTWLLEQYTTANKGRRVAVFSQFGQARWLASPIITQGITNGVFVFTPDATREEAERIVKGLNKVAEEIQSREF